MTTILAPLTENHVLRVVKDVWLSRHPAYRTEPVDFRTFVRSKEFLGLQDTAYRELIAIGEEVEKRGTREIVILAGIGSGKSFFAQVFSLYMVHLLLCLKDPHQYFHLANDKPITVINMGTSHLQAKRVIFRGISTLFQQCPWFRQFESHVLATSIAVDNNRIELVCGNSKEETPLGLNIVCAVLDEAAFYLDNEEKSVAENIYNGLRARISSRFGKRGMLLMISSPRFEGDFICTKYREGLKYPEQIAAFQLPTWKAKDRERMVAQVFVFDRQTMRIVPPEQYATYPTEEGAVNLTVSEAVNRTLAYGTDALDRRFWIIPIDFHDDFERNPERSTRDLGAEARGSIDTFLKIPLTVDMACRAYPNPVGEDGRWQLAAKPGDMVFIHIDLGLNRDGKGDACGFAVGHHIGYDKAHEGMAQVRLDLVERITAGTTGEILLSDVRARVKHLQDQGWEIAQVTMDGWQSADTLQTIQSWGITAEELSIDRTTVPYDSLKHSLYAKAVEFPAAGNPHVEVLKRELKELEIVKGKKVDHPSRGSKDVADAVAGVVHSIKEYYGNDMGNQTYSIRV